jgi:hypothetical protein
MLMDVFQGSERGGNSRLATFIVLLSSMVFLPGATLFGNDPGKLSSFVSVYFSRFEMTVPAMVAKFSILCEYCESFADYCQRADRSSKGTAGVHFGSLRNNLCHSENYTVNNNVLK